MAAGVTIARCLRWGRWPRERPENRGAAGEGVSLLLVGIGVVLVLYAIMQERLPEVEGLIATLQQALKRRNEGGITKSSSESTSLRVAGLPGEVGEKHMSVPSHEGKECSGKQNTEGAWAV